MEVFAPEYTKKEKTRLILRELIWAVPVYVTCEFWFFDWLSEYSSNSNCYFYGPITGTHLVMYGLLFLMPFTFGVILVHMIGKDAIETIKLAQHPPPNKKVFQKTKYIYGGKAKFKGFLILFCILPLFIISVWGITAANKVTSSVKTCDKLLTGSEDAKHAVKQTRATIICRDFISLGAQEA
jgi:hypothetical protein